MTISRSILLSAATTLLLGGLSHATLVQPSGAILNNSGNEITEWLTASTPKSLDTNGDGIYGTNGYDLFFAGNNLPANGITFRGLGPGITSAGPSVNYTAVDDPANPLVDKFIATTTGSGVTPGAGAVQATVITYEFTDVSLYPNGLRMGVWTDGLDGVQFSSEELYVTTTGIGGTTVQVDTTPNNNNVIDAYYFDFTGISNGDRFTLAVDVPPEGNWPTLQAITFDTLNAVPEPATATLLLLGALLVRFTRR